MLQSVGLVWASDNLRGLHGLCRAGVLHPGEVQLGWIEVAHMAQEIHPLMHMDLHSRGLRGDLRGGDHWTEKQKGTSVEITPICLPSMSFSPRSQP